MLRQWHELVSESERMLVTLRRGLQDLDYAQPIPSPQFAQRQADVGESAAALSKQWSECNVHIEELYQFFLIPQDAVTNDSYERAQT